MVYYAGNGGSMEDSNMVVCGPHVINSRAVNAIKQVPSQTDTEERLFVVFVQGVRDNIFLTDVTIEPLLKAFGLELDDVGELGPSLGLRRTRRTRRRREV